MRIHPILLLVLAGPSAVAELQWPKLQVERSAAVGAASATGTFAFTNVGKQPVEITHIHTSCGCTTAALDQTTYAPGASGAIRATLDLGARTGIQRKHIAVHWREVGADTSTERVTTLTLAVSIPEPVTLTPRFAV